MNECKVLAKHLADHVASFAADRSARLDRHPPRRCVLGLLVAADDRTCGAPRAIQVGPLAAPPVAYGAGRANGQGSCDPSPV